MKTALATPRGRRPGGAVLDKAGGTLDSRAPNGRSAGAPRLCIPQTSFGARTSRGAPLRTAQIYDRIPRPRVGLRLAVVKCDGLAHEMMHGPNLQRPSWRMSPTPSGCSPSGTSRVQRRGRANTDWVGAVPPAAAAGGLKPGLSGGIADALAMLPNLSKPSSRRY